MTNAITFIGVDSEIFHYYYITEICDALLLMLLHIPVLVMGKTIIHINYYRGVVYWYLLCSLQSSSNCLQDLYCSKVTRHSTGILQIKTLH